MERYRYLRVAVHVITTLLLLAALGFAYAQVFLYPA